MSGCGEAQRSVSECRVLVGAHSRLTCCSGCSLRASSVRPPEPGGRGRGGVLPPCEHGATVGPGSAQLGGRRRAHHCSLVPQGYGGACPFSRCGPCDATLRRHTQRLGQCGTDRRPLGAWLRDHCWWLREEHVSERRQRRSAWARTAPCSRVQKTRPRLFLCIASRLCARLLRLRSLWPVAAELRLTNGQRSAA